MVKITRAQHLALNSVRNGRCFRRYTASGNTLHSKDGCAAAVLWRLEYMKLIREGKSLTDTLAAIDLTDDGRVALRQAEAS